jgi:prepilin-type N-terminal cleavage/methylation domain-containing protein
MSTVTKRRRAGAHGFTLVETLAAMTLFALAAAAVSSIAITATRRTTQNRHAMSAAFIAQQEMEHLRGLDYANLVSETLSVPLGGQTFTVNSVVTPDLPVLNVKTVVVTVSWTGPEGSKSYAVTTYYTDVTA